MANDKIYLAQKDDLDNHINDRKNPHKLVAADIGAATPAYVDQQIALVTSTGIPKLNVVPLPIEATVDGQTEFFINLETFDALTDTVLVLDGRGMLLPNEDFIVEGSTVIVNDPWNLGDIGGLLILKNVPMGDEGSVSGSVIAPGTIPFSALEEEIQGMIKNASGAGTGKLATYFFPFEATVDGQTVFIVPLESFDIENDTVFVVDGQGMLLPGIGYTVAGREITMAEPWSLGDGGGIYVLRNTINPDAEYVSGSIIANGSIPAEKLKDEYLPLDGSKSMRGNILRLNNGSDALFVDDNVTAITTGIDEDNARWIRIYNSGAASELKSSAQLLDIVNGEHTSYRLYGEHNKPTASDVGALPITGGTVNGTITVKAGDREYQIFAYSDSFYVRTFSGSDYYDFVFNPISNETYPLRVWKNGISAKDILTSDNFKNYALPLDGSVPMSGDLKFGNGTGKIASNVDLSILSHNNKDGSSSYISIEDEANGVLATRLKYVHKGTGYPIFGKHNTELLASTIQSLIESGAINVPAVKSVQRGIITWDTKNAISASATISSVNTAKSVVIYTGWEPIASNVYLNSLNVPMLVLTDSTTVTASVSMSNTNAGGTIDVPFQVIEFA